MSNGSKSEMPSGSTVYVGPTLDIEDSIGLVSPGTPDLNDMDDFFEKIALDAQSLSSTEDQKGNTTNVNEELPHGSSHTSTLEVSAVPDRTSTPIDPFKNFAQLHGKRMIDDIQAGTYQAESIQHDESKIRKLGHWVKHCADNFQNRFHSKLENINKKKLQKVAIALGGVAMSVTAFVGVGKMLANSEDSTPLSQSSTTTTAAEIVRAPHNSNDPQPTIVIVDTRKEEFEKKYAQFDTEQRQAFDRMVRWSGEHPGGDFSTAFNEAKAAGFFDES